MYTVWVAIALGDKEDAVIGVESVVGTAIDGSKLLEANDTFAAESIHSVTGGT